MEGGFTFFPHPWASWAGGFGVSINDGGAKITAVDEMTAFEAAEVEVSDAPAGRRGATCFDFCACGRRTGAKASEADHPSD
jgi:hypothetical protein